MMASRRCVCSIVHQQPMIRLLIQINVSRGAVFIIGSHVEIRRTAMNTIADPETDSRWQACVMATVGIALLASPWLMEYPQPVSSNAVATGSAITVFALLAIVTPALWEEAVLLMMGCWSVASPWILGFVDQRGAALICVVAGGIVLISALWSMKNEDRPGAGGRSATNAREDLPER